MMIETCRGSSAIAAFEKSTTLIILLTSAISSSHRVKKSEKGVTSAIERLQRRPAYDNDRLNLDSAYGRVTSAQDMRL
jgi:hypothetical protein